MGEIGIPRNTFLYELQYWEVLRIVRGYRRRDILKYQLLRLCAYQAHFAMRDNPQGITPTEWLPLPFDTDAPSAPPISPSEADDLRDLLNDLNRKGDH